MNVDFTFTKRCFEQLNLLEKRYRVHDIGQRDSVKGLYLDVLPSGKKVFRFRRKVLGKDITVTIGHFPSLTIENSRKLACKHSSQIAEGNNPNQLKQLAKQQLQQEEALSLSVGQLYDAYIEEFKIKIKTGERRQKSLEDADSIWRNHVQKKLGHIKVEKIAANDAENFLKILLTKNSPSVRNKCLTLLKSMFNDQPINPFSNIKKYAGTKRERILSEVEVKKLLHALEGEKQIYRDVVMMLLLTGQRKNCVFSMEWKEIDHQSRLWIIPTSKMKVKKPHAVPLTDEAMSILERRSSEATAGEKYVFPAMTSKTRHIIEKSGRGSFWYRITQRANLRSEERSENVTIHDLRRTIASWSVMRGGNIQITSKLLGHSDISITASTYAHLDVENVRAELGITTAKLLGSNLQLTKVERLIREIKLLSNDDRKQLKEAIESMILTE